jgi:hypothetical protein
MNRIISIVALLLAAIGADAATRISLTVTVTNVPVTGATLTINSSTRTWTNLQSSSYILTNLTSKNASATNLFNNYASYAIGSGITHAMSGTNSVVFTAPLGVSLSGSMAGNWATTIMATQSGPSTFTALWPMENMVGETNRTNQGSTLVYGMGIYSTNAFQTNATALSNFITKGASPIQTISSPLTVSGALRAQAQLFATNGFTSSITNINQVSSNGVNYGNAFSSPGSYPNSEQFGSGSGAGGGGSLQIGKNAIALTNGVAIGFSASAGRFSIALGASADTSPATNSIGIGQNVTINSASNAIALGNGIIIGDRHHDSVVIGNSGASTTNGQIVLGAASIHTVVIPGVLAVSGTITNSTFKGTNVLDGRLDLKPGSRTSLANGYNSGTILGTNVYLRMSGPSAAYTNAGFAAAVDGTWHKLQFDNPGLSYTILHDSGLDATAANRVYTGTGALVNSTNNPAFLELLYDANVSRWRVISIR